MNEIRIDKIIRSKRKTIALIVSSEAKVIVRAPLMVNLEYIKKFVFEKRFWINKKKNQIFRNGGPAKSKEFVNGEEFLYLGNAYQLKIENCKAIKLSDYLYFPEKYLKNSRVKMIKWYKQKAREKITERVLWYSRVTGWKFKSISITSAEKRWGSCGSSGSINFSWKLIMAPLQVVDYVVAHELAHLVEKNHSAKFWNKVKAILPDYKARQRWLKDKGRNLGI